MLQDSGSRTTFKSGAVRDMSKGKGRFDLLEPELLFRLAKHYEDGAQKYDERNWEKGIPVNNLIDSATRHLIKYLQGWGDEDHLAAVVWNVACVMRFEKDDRKDLLNLPWQQGRLTIKGGPTYGEIEFGRTESAGQVIENRDRLRLQQEQEQETNTKRTEKDLAGIIT